MVVTHCSSGWLLWSILGSAGLAVGRYGMFCNGSQTYFMYSSNIHWGCAYVVLAHVSVSHGSSSESTLRWIVSSSPEMTLLRCMKNRRLVANGIFGRFFISIGQSRRRCTSATVDRSSRISRIGVFITAWHVESALHASAAAFFILFCTRRRTLHVPRIMCSSMYGARRNVAIRP